MKKEELLYYTAVLLLICINIYFFMDADWALEIVKNNPELANEPNENGIVPMNIATASFGYLAIGTIIMFAGIAMFAQRTRVARFIFGIAIFMIFVFFDVQVWYIFAINFIAIAILFLYSYKESFIDSVRRR